MKVISKGSRSNKSTPSLNCPTKANLPAASSKPKGIGKITTFKQILTQNHTQSVNQNLALSKKYQPQNRPNTQRNMFQKEKLYNGQTVQQPNKNQVISSIMKMGSSVDLKGFRTQGDCRSSTQSIQLIDSVVHYGQVTNKILHSNQSNQFQRIKSNKSKAGLVEWSANQISNSVNSAKSINQSSWKHVPAFEQGKENHGNVNGRIVENNEGKKMNYYKNMKINQYNVKQTVRKISLASFKLGKKIGRGRFGCVYIAQDRQTGMVVALKLVDLLQVKQQQMQNQIIEELRLQLFMNNPNILKMYGCFKDGDQLCMILQYAEGKCLFNHLVNEMEQKKVGYYTRQMIQALKYCHSESILHRDLKPQNILLCFGVAKLADFGWAAYAPKNQRNTFCGTLDYVPPQILKGQNYDQKVDIWSLGVLIYEMATGKAPFQSPSINPVHTETRTMNRIIGGDLLIPSKLSLNLKLLINSILSTEPYKRPTLQQIQNSVWMKLYRDSGTQIQKYIWQQWLQLSSN